MNKRQTTILLVGAVIGIALIIAGLMHDPSCPALSLADQRDYLRTGISPSSCQPSTDLTTLLVGSGIGIFVLAGLLALSPWGRDRT